MRTFCARKIFMRYTLLQTIVWSVLVCCSGCVIQRSPAPVIHHYTLEYDPPRLAIEATTERVLAVQPFTVAAPYASRRIIYRDAKFRRDAYVYHQWRAHPGDLVADMLRRDLQQIGFFRAVVGLGSSVASSYVLEGTVEEFFVAELPDRWEAVMSLSITLLDAHPSDTSHIVLFQKTYSTRVLCRKHTPQSIVAAMSSAMAELSHSICTDIMAAVMAASTIVPTSPERS